jgi:threonine dehydrogenase-like Zn-dependent dehydrogenase
MKALVWYGTRDVRFEDAPDPEAVAGEVVLDVELAGICGSDLHGYRGHPGPRVPPLVLGHEVVGSVDGETYTVFPLVGCGACDRCAAGEENLCASWRLIGMHRQGVFAERLALPESCLVPLPAGLDPRRAVLAEPLACCVGALAPSGHAGEVVVLGCGPIGLLSSYVAALEGAHVTVVDPVPERREHAFRLGAHAGVASGDELEPGFADIVVDAAGFEPTWRTALASVRNGGEIVMLGLGQAEGPFPMAVLVRRAIRLRGQFAYSRVDFARAVQLLARGDMDLGWLSDAPLDEGAEAFANLVDRPAEYAKVLLTP